MPNVRFLDHTMHGLAADLGRLRPSAQGPIRLTARHGDRLSQRPVKTSVPRYQDPSATHPRLFGLAREAERTGFGFLVFPCFGRGGVFSARRNASSRRRAASGSEKASLYSSHGLVLRDSSSGNGKENGTAKTSERTPKAQTGSIIKARGDRWPSMMEVAESVTHAAPCRRLVIGCRR